MWNYRFQVLVLWLVSLALGLVGLMWMPLDWMRRALSRAEHRAYVRVLLAKTAVMWRLRGGVGR